MKLPFVTAALLGLSLPLAVEAGAQTLQPGMRTMIQRGGPEGVLLGVRLPLGIDDPAYDALREVVRVRN
ncbi:hypothetical protein [Methylobacterium sp. B4]|uniref:hypothetical protein n=1 Tax=Methylobacterium sp. B4 TaxID=1938755 RepID=UPI000D77463C|nr:hypothetical protein [Methylobacterium sp. B4]PXW66527.1 hypothetical protein BY998_10185 [Methylobacterium sp. B4]